MTGPIAVVTGIPPVLFDAIFFVSFGCFQTVCVQDLTKYVGSYLALHIIFKIDTRPQAEGTMQS
jgi:hypothetical protein